MAICIGFGQKNHTYLFLTADFSKKELSWDNYLLIHNFIFNFFMMTRYTFDIPQHKNIRDYILNRPVLESVRGQTKDFYDWKK